MCQKIGHWHIVLFQTDDISIFLFENSTQSSSIILLLSSLLIRKCLARCVIDCISCTACAIGICELVLWRCHRGRFISLLIVDIFFSLILLWTLFYEQYADKLLLKIKYYLHNKIEEEKSRIRQKPLLNERYVIIGSFQSPVFVMQVIIASLSFITTLLSYKHKGM